MARVGSFIKFDTSDVERLGQTLGDITGAGLALATVTALNAVVDRTYDLSRDRITTGINLSDDYLRRRMSVERATASKPVASITASGARNDMTVLGRFNARPNIEPNSAPGKRKGFRALGIQPGAKQQGVTVEVRRGADASVDRGFLLPLNKGTESGGNGFGVFARTKDGRLRHRYGPSVYQLFSYQIPRITDEVTDDLEETLLAQVDEQMQRAFE